MKRGEIWWASLGPPRGSAPAYRRPVIIVSRSSINKTSIGTIVVVVLTSNLRLAGAPGNFVVPARRSGLREDSVANVSQISTIDKSDVGQRIGRLPDDLMDLLEDGLRLMLALD